MRKYIITYTVYGVDQTKLMVEVWANDDESAKFYAKKLGDAVFGSDNFSHTTA